MIYMKHEIHLKLCNRISTILNTLCEGRLDDTEYETTALKSQCL